MPQPKSQTRRRRSTGARKTTAKRATSTRKTSAASKRSTPAKRTGAKRSTAAKRGTAKRTTAKRSTAKRSTARSRAAAQDDVVRANLKAFRDALSRGVINPLNLVMLTRDRMQEVFDDAVKRGRVTRDDANDLAGDLFRRGRKQTDDILSDFEQLLGRSREQLEHAGADARKRASAAGKRARRAPRADRVLREVDRARRSAGLGASFPILGYDDLSAGQIADRVSDLTPAQLRKVRDYERRNANRKSVLSAIERALS
jgi:polyhydroxyalkanoate synthesis regulator phasin